MEFNQIQLDALREISSIAAGNAATGLSGMLGRKVNISTPNIMIEAIEKLPEALWGKENIANVLYFSVSGQISGSILMILSVSESLRLVYVLTGKKASQTESLGEMGLSALKELGNITTGWYLRALSQGLKVRITHSIPGFASDMLGAILDGNLARLSLEAEHVVMMENEFTVEKDVCKGHLIFIPEPESLKVMLQALGVWETYSQGAIVSSTSGIPEHYKLMDVFYEEAQSLIDEMRKELSVLGEERVPTIFHRLFNCAHTIRGSAGVVGFDELRETAQALEMIFKAAQDGKIRINAEVIRLLSESVEVCRKLLNKEEVDNYEELLNRLYTICPSV